MTSSSLLSLKKNLKKNQIQIQRKRRKKILTKIEVLQQYRESAKFVEKEAKSEPWRDIHDIADKFQPALSKVIALAVRKAQISVKLKELTKAFEEKDREEIAKLVFEATDAYEKELKESAPPILFLTLAESGESAGFTAKAERTYKTAEVVLGFDRTNPLATKFAREQSSAMVVGITRKTREAIRMIIERAFVEGIPPRAAARLIRPMIGLTERDALAVINARLRKGLTEKQLQRYSDKLLRARSVNIARTETIRSSNEGLRQLWTQAEQNGLLTGQEERIWIATPDERLCPICEPLDGQRAKLNLAFISSETGEEFMGPPAHPQCRCAQGLI